jgi:hypothetical protein
VSPDGTTTACLVTGAGTSFGGLVRADVATLASTTYTLSCFAKAGTYNFLGLTIQGASTPSGQYSHFNLSTGVATAVTAQSGTIVSASMTPFPNGWYRCVLVHTTASNQGATSLLDICITQPNGQHDYSGTGNLFIWGAQLEVGSFATSYIPTTTGSLARSADVCSITGGNFTGMWNQSEGTLLAQTQKTSTNSNAFVISASDNSFNNETDLRYSSVSQVGSLMNVSNVNQLIGFGANITSGAAVKQSIAYKLNDCAYAANGASPISDTSALIPTVDRLTIGNVAVAGQAFYLNGQIAAIRYYKKRLPNAKLAQLTV